MDCRFIFCELASFGTEIYLSKADPCFALIYKYCTQSSSKYQGHWKDSVVARLAFLNAPCLSPWPRLLGKYSCMNWWQRAPGFIAQTKSTRVVWFVPVLPIMISSHCFSQLPFRQINTELCEVASDRRVCSLHTQHCLHTIRTACCFLIRTEDKTDHYRVVLKVKCLLVLLLWKKSKLIWRMPSVNRCSAFCFCL